MDCRMWVKKKQNEALVGKVGKRVRPLKEQNKVGQRLILLPGNRSLPTCAVVKTNPKHGEITAHTPTACTGALRHGLDAQYDSQRCPQLPHDQCNPILAFGPLGILLFHLPPIDRYDTRITTYAGLFCWRGKVQTCNNCTPLSFCSRFFEFHSGLMFVLLRMCRVFGVGQNLNVSVLTAPPLSLYC